LSAVGTMDKALSMGLGDAIRRLTAVEWSVRLGHLSPELEAERHMLLEALNVIPVKVGFDCGDGAELVEIPDNVDMFNHAVSTSCCRLRPQAPPTPRRSSRKKDVVEAATVASAVEAPTSDAPPSSDSPSEDAPASRGKKRKKGFLSNLFGDDT